MDNAGRMGYMLRIIRGIKRHGIIGSYRYACIHIRSFCRRCARSLKIVLAKLRAEECYVAKEIQGSKMLLNLNDVGISQELYFTGIHEPESTKQTLKEIKPSMTVFTFRRFFSHSY